MSLLNDTARLFHQEPALAALYGFTPEKLQSDAELLAAVLAGLVPDGPARYRLRDLVGDAFAEDAEAVSLALEDLAATAERDLGTDAARVLLFAPGYQGLLSHRAARAAVVWQRNGRRSREGAAWSAVERGHCARGANRSARLA